MKTNNHTAIHVQLAREIYQARTKGTTMRITLEIVRDQWQACYPAERLAKLYDRPMSPREVLTRKDGDWAGVSDKDRLWTVLREDVLPTRVLQSIAIVAGECALLNERQCGREPGARSYAAYAAAYAASNAAAIVNHVIAELDAMAPVAEPEATPTN